MVWVVDWVWIGVVDWGLIKKIKKKIEDENRIGDVILSNPI